MTNLPTPTPNPSPQGGGEHVVVVIPTFNEAESIAAVVAEIPRDVVDRVIVADGGSRDGTPEKAGRAGAEVIAVGRGYGLACLKGAQAALAKDIVVFMDGDGADDPAAIADAGRADPLRHVRLRHRLARPRRARAGQHGLAPARRRPHRRRA